MARWKHDKAMVRAIVAKDPEGVQKALAKGADPNHEVDGHGPMTRPLLIAAVSQNAATMRLLLDAGADIEGRGAIGQTALHHAWEPQLVRVLLAAGANIHTRTSENLTPLHSTPRLESCELLLAAGADAFAMDIQGRRPFESIGALVEAARRRGLDGAIVEEGRAVINRLRSIVENTNMEENTGPALASPEMQKRRVKDGRI